MLLVQAWLFEKLAILMFEMPISRHQYSNYPHSILYNDNWPLYVNLRHLARHDEASVDFLSLPQTYTKPFTAPDADLIFPIRMAFGCQALSQLLLNGSRRPSGFLLARLLIPRIRPAPSLLQFQYFVCSFAFTRSSGHCSILEHSRQVTRLQFLLLSVDCLVLNLHIPRPSGCNSRNFLAFQVSTYS